LPTCRSFFIVLFIIRNQNNLKTVLIVEDDIDTLDLMEFILQDNGYAVVKANKKVNIEDVIAINPHLAIIDFLLPLGFGTELCLEIKTNPLTNHIPVILYSASNDIKELALTSCADAYMAKPFDIDELVDLVSAMVL